MIIRAFYPWYFIYCGSSHESNIEVAVGESFNYGHFNLKEMSLLILKVFKRKQRIHPLGYHCAYMHRECIFPSASCFESMYLTDTAT